MGGSPRQFFVNWALVFAGASLLYFFGQGAIKNIGGIVAMFIAFIGVTTFLFFVIFDWLQRWFPEQNGFEGTFAFMIAFVAAPSLAVFALGIAGRLLP